MRESALELFNEILNTSPVLWALSIFSSSLLLLMGGWSQLLATLAAAIVVDYITGVLRAGYEGKLDSEKGTRGLIKKSCILIMVIVGHFTDMLILQGQVHFFRDIMINLLLANEILSLLENLGAMGIPIPEKVKALIELFRGGDKEC